MQIVLLFFVVLLTFTLNLLKNRRPVIDTYVVSFFGMGTFEIHNLQSLLIFWFFFAYFAINLALNYY